MWLLEGFAPESTKRIKDMHRIALICYGGLGDVLLFSPVVREIKRWLPDVHITVYVEARSAGVSSVLADVDAVMSMPVQALSRPALAKWVVKDMRMRHFDGVISTGTNPFIAGVLTAAGIAYRIGYDTKSWAMKLMSHTCPVKKHAYAGEMYLELAKTFLKPLIGPAYEAHGVSNLPYIKTPDEEHVQRFKNLKIPRLPDHRKHILIHPGVSRVSQQKGIYKDWPPARWAQFILDLSKDHAVYLIGGPDDQPAVEAILKELPDGLAHFKSLVGETTSFEELAALMGVMDVVCVVDSAPLHLSIGLDKPTLAFFGPTNNAVLVPESDSVHVVRRQDLECQPCLWAVRQKNCADSTCLDVSVDTMLDGLDQLLKV
jgi:ADP-heptose:LPS heptosyltransferase